jgi:hypothetical protein
MIGFRGTFVASMGGFPQTNDEVVDVQGGAFFAVIAVPMLMAQS